MISSIKRQKEYRNRKAQRPFMPGQPMSVVLKARSVCFGPHRNWMNGYVHHTANRNGVTLYHVAINGNHVQFLLRAPTREALCAFLRAFCGVTARQILGAQRGRSSQENLWATRPYSRVVCWGREFSNVLRYIERNLLEYERRIEYVPRTRPLPAGMQQLVNESLILRHWERLSRQLQLAL